jgi:biopolymer transport protein ExbD/biopolymer transport protein TolR
MSTPKRKQRDAFTEINITPLTDIFLVLLIIMMVIAPLLDQQGLNLTVPSQHEAEKQEKESKIITINVSQSGQYSIDGKNISADVLLQAIKTAYHEKRDGLLIKAAQDSTHEAVVKVMDAAQTAGVASVSVMEN